MEPMVLKIDFFCLKNKITSIIQNELLLMPDIPMGKCGGCKCNVWIMEL
jgi:hypothetical protein